ncbi:endoplasmic reticulum metallopeptidase 1 isoform X3 [Puntigrus tetrazona]|uniref:endoplasmic reticulum metallopeptidase 1 isoform X3 n=1 Tax=Puntigrus tetrazona TaxID=1606681 RepID=UPI001C89AB3B|nr:endoplasmic reticulum metallopeptidase 1 isoform X3 [Puntigrus tetrazona]
MERDTTVRRIRPQQNQNQTGPDCGDEAAAPNGLRRRKPKPEVSSGLLRESSAALLLLGFVVLLWVLVLLSLQQLIISSPGLFNAPRARKHLERITSVGPRTVGSPENEITTVNYLLEQIEQIRSESRTGPHSITVDVQRPTGSFSIDFLGGFTSYYDRVTNIAVKLEPKTTAQHFMLANCHFDSVANSPGASDDAVSCSVMLEVLHSLANLSAPLKHGVIFLFNGAEENILQASHGFITQHPWAQQVRAFINLEAAGVGGKEVVFQTGPENPWLVQAYVRSAVHPFASVVGQEVFQSGVIPSDTDFRIYRDFGNIPGIDLAFIENGFIYHTKYDTPERIHTDSIQRAGDNILSVLKHLLMSEELADSSAYRHGNMVFFDLLGVTVVAYPARVGTIINLMAAVATVIYLGRKCRMSSAAGGRYLRELACAVCVCVMSWFVTLLTVLIVALLVTLAGRSMFWYTHFYAAVCLYGSAAAGKILLIHTLARNLYYGGVSGVDLAERFFDVGLLLWCGVLLFFTQRGLCSAYVPMMMVVFPLAGKLLLSGHFRARGASLQYSVLYLMGLSVPYVHIMFLIWVVFEIFTPILGRSGTEIPPDVVLASLITLATVILSSYLMHFIYLSRSTKRILAGLGSVFALMFVLVCCGQFFPYSADPSSPRPKRIFIQHSTRVFHAPDGSVQRSDSGLWINSLDYSGMQHVTPLVPEINDSVRSRCSEQLPYCGFPWFLPVKFLVKKNWYLPAPPVAPRDPLEFKLLSRHENEWGSVKISFQAKGPTHMSLYVRPAAGASLIGWSFGDGTPSFDLSGEYFIFYSHGLGAPAWSFWFEVQRSSDASPDEDLISLAISSHYFSGPDRRSEPLEALLQRFPAWAFPSAWVSTYHMYRY